MVSWFHDLSLSALHETKKPVNMVSWFRPLHLWDIEMTIGFMVSWFLSFTVSCTPSLDIEMTIGFMVSCTPNLGYSATVCPAQPASYNIRLVCIVISEGHSDLPKLELTRLQKPTMVWSPDSGPMRGQVT